MANSWLKFTLPRISGGGSAPEPPSESNSDSESEGEAGGGAAPEEADATEEAEAPEGGEGGRPLLEDVERDCADIEANAPGLGETLTKGLERVAEETKKILESLKSGLERIAHVVEMAGEVFLVSLGVHLGVRFAMELHKIAESESTSGPMAFQRMTQAVQDFTDSVILGLLRSQVVQTLILAMVDVLVDTSEWLREGGWRDLAERMVVPFRPEGKLRSAMRILETAGNAIAIVVEKMFVTIQDYVQSIIDVFPPWVALQENVDKLKVAPPTRSSVIREGPTAVISLPGTETYATPQSVMRTAEYGGLKSEDQPDQSGRVDPEAAAARLLFGGARRMTGGLKADLARREALFAQQLEDIAHPEDAARRELAETSQSPQDIMADGARKGTEAAAESIANWTTSPAAMQVVAHLNDVLTATTKSLEPVIAKIGASLEAFRKNFAEAIPARLAPLAASTASFTDALKSVSSQVDGIAATNGAAAKIQMGARVAFLAATALVMSVVETAAGIASWPDYWAMGLHFTAAGLYIAAAALAVAGAVVGGSGGSAPAPPTRGSQIALGAVPRAANLTLNVSGPVHLPDSYWLQTHVLDVIASGGASVPEYVPWPFIAEKTGPSDIFGTLIEALKSNAEEIGITIGITSATVLGASIAYYEINGPTEVDVSGFFSDVAGFFSDTFGSTFGGLF